MSKKVLLFVLASVLMPFCISAQDYAVKGSVWDFDTAEPICSVAVSVYQITGNDTTFYGGCSTDDNGSFIIGQLKAGNYVLYAKSDNHFNTSKSFTLSSENVKERWVEILRENYHIFCAIDDDPKNCEMFAKNNILTMQVHK